MKVLTLEPPCARLAHYVIQTQSVTHALCSKKNQHIREGAEIKQRRAVWVVREQTVHDQICMSCERSLAALERLSEPRPPLPCTDPDRIVTLWTRQNDDRALVHSLSPDFEKRSHCGVKNTDYAPERWTATPGKRAALITCSFCLKAEGLYKGHPPHKQESKTRPEIDHKRVWFDRWYESQGAYHHSDPRAEK